MRASGITLFFSVVAVAAASPIAAATHEQFVPYPEAGGVRLGTGWDSFTGSKTTASCVEAAEVADPGQRRLVSYKEVSDASSLMNALSVSAKAKAKSLLGGSASASSSFSRTVKVDSASLNLAVDVKIMQGAKYLAPPRLGRALGGSLAVVRENAPVGALLTSSDPGDAIRLTRRAAQLYRQNRLRFRAECGDSFVSSIRSGAGLQGVYAFQTRTVDEKRELSAKIKAGFGPFSGQAEMRQIMERMDRESRLAINYFQLGGAGTPIATNEPTFRTLVETIGSITSENNAAPFEIGITSYSRLGGVGADDGQGDMDAMANQYYRLFSLRKEIDEMLTGNAYHFDKRVTKDELSRTQDRIVEDMGAIRSALQACTSSTAGCTFPAGTAKTDYGYRMLLPVRADNVEDVVHLQSLRSQLATKQSQLAGTRSTIRIRLPHGFISIPNPAYASLKREVDSLAGQISTAEASTDSTKERFATWIDLPNRARCQEEEHDVCLPSSETSAMLQQMLDQPL